MLRISVGWFNSVSITSQFQDGSHPFKSVSTGLYAKVGMEAEFSCPLLLPGMEILFTILLCVFLLHLFGKNEVSWSSLCQ